MASWVCTEHCIGLRKGTGDLDLREESSVLLEFGRQQELFFVLFWQGKSKCSMWLISAGAVSRGATTGQLLEDGDSDCVWPPLGDAKGLEGREPDRPCEDLIEMLSGFELEHSCNPQHTHHAGPV